MKTWVKRALRTFVQTACGYLSTVLVTTLSGITDTETAKTALVGLCVSAVAAGLSAVMNLREE